MNGPRPLESEQIGTDGPIFISYATADKKQALSVCKAIERRGPKCWIASRDVPPGENYQEAIVRSLRTARAMVLVFSGAANNSDEIKKELSLASRYHISVMALRIEDVEPSDAFAYELSTRQWIDAFTSWDKSIDALVKQVGNISAPGPDASQARAALPRQRAGSGARLGLLSAAAGMLLIAIAATWWFLRPAPAVHTMMVRLTGFQRLSADLPATMPDAIRDEITAAFGDQGVVGVSTASTASPGTAPAYALGGTIRRDGNQIRVITRLTNERSGATLWSSSSNYDADQLSRVPRRIAVQSALMSRCGLFGASTYRKPLPDSVMADYMQYCLTEGAFPTAPEKALDSARKVVAAVPDFAWGWSAVAESAAQSLSFNGQGPRRDEFRQIGLQAAERGLSLDSRNSAALAQKSRLIDARDLIAQETLLKQAIAARPLDCGCEHLLYGIMLQNVGRYGDSVPQFQRAVDMLALDGNSQFLLADSLIAIGKRDEAKPHFDAAVDLIPDSDFADQIAVIEATETGNYAAGIKALNDPKLQLAAETKSALLAGYRAMASGDVLTKEQAIRTLMTLPDAQKSYLVIKTLAALGADHQALDLFIQGVGSRSDWTSLLWYPSMRSVLSDPRFPALAQKLGFMRYWRTTRKKPDVCSGKTAPAFCQII